MCLHTCAVSADYSRSPILLFLTVVAPLYAMLFFGDEDVALACRGGEYNPVEESYFREQNEQVRVQGLASWVQFGEKNDTAGYTQGVLDQTRVQSGAGQSAAPVRPQYRRGTQACRGSAWVYPVLSFFYLMSEDFRTIVLSLPIELCRCTTVSCTLLYNSFGNSPKYAFKI